jgi:hypothetical protein
MPHPLVDQLRFARSEFVRGLENLDEEDARRRLQPLNSISWIIGHLAWQEQRFWLFRGQNITLLPKLDELVGYGQPATTPPLAEMWRAWNTITKASDSFLNDLTTEMMPKFMIVNGLPHAESIGSMILRVTYHYWYRLGEALSVRQLLGHQKLPEFVGDLHGEAPYRVEAGN